MGHPIDRRQFFRRAGTLGFSIGSAALIGAGCAKSPTALPATSTTTTSTTTTSTSGPLNWTELQQMLSGSLVLPNNPSYGSVKLLFNEQFDGIDPAAIALCRTPSDVQRCVSFARQHGVAVAARSGGHSYGGYSLSTGLVIDVTAMADISVSSGTARIGAGARLIDVYDTLGTAGVLVPGGSCPTVGIAGLTLGGGIGVFDRLYGLTCDNLRSVQMVLADGSLVTASPGDNPDLFWACQGGGGGNFGIATSFEFGVHPIPDDIALFTLDWPWSAAQSVLGAWQAWLPSIPKELWSNCQLSASGSSLSVRVGGVFAGTTSALDTELAALVSAVGSAPSSRFVGPETYLNAMFIEAGCEGLSVGECHLPSQNPDGTLSRSAYAAKSTFVVAPFGTSGLEAAANALALSQQIAPGIGAAFLFDSYGGAINSVAPSATAFVHRDALAGIQMTGTWGSGVEPSNVSSWLTTAAADLAPYTSGAYQNYIDPTLSDWQQAYYGANLARLVQVKAAVDPDDVFHFAQSIPTSLAS